MIISNFVDFFLISLRIIKNFISLRRLEILFFIFILIVASLNLQIVIVSIQLKFN